MAHALPLRCKLGFTIFSNRELVVTSLIVQCVLGLCVMVGGMDIHDLTSLGSRLTEKQAVALEANLKDSPDDVDSRTTLIAYYFRAQFRDRPLAVKHREHVLWLIEKSPEAEVLSMPCGSIDRIIAAEDFEKAKKLYLKHLELQPKNLRILQSAAKFFRMSHPAKAEELLKQAETHAPKDPKWSLELGQLYSLKLVGNTEKDEKRAAAAEALKHFERSYELSTEIGRDAMLTSLGKMALAAGDLDKAKTYASKMIPTENSRQDWNYGNKFYSGNQLLGRIALAAGDVDGAKSFLLESAKTPGSPQLGSFGPNMQLASELLEAGEKETVLEFFENCKSFWGMGAEKLDAWRDAVNTNQQPVFGANLNY